MSWSEIEIGQVADIKHGFPFKSDFFTDHGKLVVLTPGNCQEHGGFRDKGEDEKFYEGPVPEGYLLHQGDLLVVMTDLVSTAPVLGGAFLIPDDARYLHNQRLGLVDITRPDLIDKGFLYYLFNTNIYRAQVQGSASGATVRHTSPNRIKKCKVRCPRDLKVQQRIAECLAAYEGMIENNRRRMLLLEDSARLLYREWFIHFRFPGHEHVEIADGLPRGWERKTLGDVAQMNSESYGAKELPAEIKYVDISSVKRGRIVSKSLIPSSEAPGRARRRVRDGDVVWSNVRPNLRAYALILDPDDNDVFSTGFTVLSVRAVPYSWLYMFVTTDSFVGHLVNHATGAGYPAVRPDDFQRAEAVVPTASLLNLFHQAVEPNLRLISKLNQQNGKLAQARDLLLPRLMSGELAV
jgi:type I restriction enzyme S subunit